MDEPTTLDYYECLGVDPSSSVRDIKRAFFRLAKVHHPDKQAPGTCSDAEDFRKVREAQETLCDEIRRRNYDLIHTSIQCQWMLYRKQQEATRIEEEERKIRQEILRQAEAEAARRRVEEDLRKKQEEAEKARKAAEQRAWLQAEIRRREEQREAERQRLRKEQELLIEKAKAAERARVRAQKEKEAEERSKEVARLARVRQEKAAIERLRKAAEIEAEQERLLEELARQARELRAEREKMLRETARKEKEMKAQKRWEEAGRKRREQQNKEAKERLVQMLVEEQQALSRKNWAMLRENAESRRVVAEPVELPHPQARPVCDHPTFGWPKKKGPTSCNFCGSRCAKFSFQCPDCDAAACASCKHQRFSSI